MITHTNYKTIVLILSIFNFVMSCHVDNLDSIVLFNFWINLNMGV